MAARDEQYTLSSLAINVMHSDWNFALSYAVMGFSDDNQTCTTRLQLWISQHALKIR